MSLLACRGVSKSFGGVRAIQDVSIAVEEGSLVSLIGPNGAGKTTLFNCITGLFRPDGGEIEIGGVRTERSQPHRIARLGAVRTFQNIRMFPGLTVLESLLVAQHVGGKVGVLSSVSRLPRYRADWNGMLDRARSVMELLEIGEFADYRADRLPLLLQRIVEIARAIVADPRILLLDEPTAGATLKESEHIKRVIRQIREQGLTVLLIEHSMRVVMSISDHVHVMNFGRLIASGRPEEIRENREVQEVYLGVPK